MSLSLWLDLRLVHSEEKISDIRCYLKNEFTLISHRSFCLKMQKKWEEA